MRTDELSIGAAAPPLGQAEQHHLLSVARRAIARAVAAPTGAGARTADACAPAPAAPARVREAGRAFVTITIDGELAGCIGLLGGDRPLDEVVADAAMGAAVRDPRFAPVQASDLTHAHLEVSVLGPFEPFAGLDAFGVGRDGVMITVGGRRALLLPEVATEMGWDAREMLRSVCAKAGLPRDAWQRPDADVVIFRTQRFGGPATGY